MKIAVIIPMYRPVLHWYERIALKQAKRLFGDYPIFYLIPEGLNVKAFMSDNTTCASFPAQFFKGVDGYNELMLSNIFYQRFAEYDYILIYQLDAFAFSNQLERFCRMGYDYIGAPWSFCGHKIIEGRSEIMRVGNGGFSLRNPQACLALLKKYAQQLQTWEFNEDNFFAFFGKKKENDFRLAPIAVARQFSCEINAARCYRKNGNTLPFGCHGWHIYSADFYLDAFSKVGYDLRPYRGQMKTVDLGDQAYRLHFLMKSRLWRRLSNSQSILRYLPKDSKTYVAHVIGRTSAHLLQQLRKEGCSFFEQIFCYKEGDISSIIDNMEKLSSEVQPALILSINDDSDVIAKLISDGMRYGKDFWSFWQEYIRYWTQWLQGFYATKEK